MKLLEQSTDDRKLLIKKNVVELFKQSTIHGLHNIFMAEKPFFKIFWSTCFSISICCCAVSIINNTLDYFKYDTVTRISVIYESPLIFPTITFCNLNGFSSENTTALINQLTNDGRFPSTDQIINEFRLKANKLDINVKKSLGPKIEDMLISCSFNFVSCNTQDFEWHYSREYGNCFKFNAGSGFNGSLTGLKRINQPGFDSGLTVELISGSSDNILTRKYNGFNIFIDNHTVDLLDYEGMTVKPGLLTSIVVKKKVTEELPYPYSQCMGSNSDDELHGYFKESSRLYRRASCQILCYQKNVTSDCGCFDPKYAKYNIKAKPCNHENSLLCINEHYEEFLAGQLGLLCANRCPKNCHEITYDFFKTISAYPTEPHMNKLQNNPVIRKHFNRSTTPGYEDYKQNVLAARIYFNDLSYTSVIETEKINIIDLAANYGGQLGLFLGVSLMTFVEIIELFFSSINIWFTHEN